MSELKLKYKFIGFYETVPGKWICYNNKSNAQLGYITLYEPWNQYVIEFNQDAVFNNQCLNDISNFLTQINKKAKEPELSF